MRNAIGAVLVGAGLLTGGAAPRAAEIALACGSGPLAHVCFDAAEQWAKATGNTIKPVSVPNSSTEQLALYQQFLSNQSPDIDVFQIDVIWPGLIGQHLLDLSETIPAEEIGTFLPTLVDNNTVDGRLVALPQFTEAPLLYYRTDLLEKHGKRPPETWAELFETAKAIQDAERAAGNAQLWGFVYQGKAYEGLTCVALEWLASFGGGTIVDENGKVTVNNPQAAAALDWARTTVGTIAPDGVLNYGEEEARGVFQSGNAVFMRNWPYAWSLAQGDQSPVRGKVGVVPLPAGEPGGLRTGTLGGWQLAVSRYSRSPEAAVDLVRHLTSAEEQRRRAIGYAYNPTIPALYDDPEVQASVPFFAALREVVTNGVARPSRVTGAKYNQVSAEFWNAAHSVLAGQADGATAVAALAERLDRISRGGRW